MRRVNNRTRICRSNYYKTSLAAGNTYNVYCIKNPPTGQSTDNIYHYIGGSNTMRKYPNTDIADNWSSKTELIDCKDINIDSNDMDFKEGTPIRCSSQPQNAASYSPNNVYRYSPNNVYRYTTNNIIKWYPNSVIASSWDINYNNAKSIDCSNMTVGDNMHVYINKTITQPGIHYNIQCLTNKPLNYSQNHIYHYIGGSNTMHKYPSDYIRDTWRNSMQNYNPYEIDCQDINISSQIMDIKEGTPIRCSNPPKNAKDYNKRNVYRYMTNNIIRWYENPNIAKSWDPDYDSARRIDCSNMTQTDNMDLKEGTPITEGTPIKCSTQPKNAKDYNIKNVYRYTTNNIIKLYPNTVIASSWDPNYDNATSIDCSNMTQGDNMDLNYNLPISVFK